MSIIKKIFEKLKKNVEKVKEVMYKKVEILINRNLKEIEKKF